MTYLLNTWYVGAWSYEIEEGLSSRTILGKSIVFFRDVEGKAVAAHNRCPHRFAPLDRGRIVDGMIECGYHGLRFSAQGKCVFNPDGDGKVPAGSALTLFPVVERWNAVWIWMGDPAKADTSLIPEYPFLDTPEWHPVRGLIRVGANYRYIIDNLLDIAHLKMLHPTSGIYCESLSRGKSVISREPNGAIWVKRLGENGAPPPILGEMWSAAGLGELSEQMDHGADARWDAPSLVMNHLSLAMHGEAREITLQMMNTHFITPETETSSHYFWSNCRTFAHDNAAMDAGIAAGIEHIFVDEDAAMLQAIQDSMEDDEFWSLKPALIQADIGPVAVRRALDKLIAEERQEA